VTDRRGQLVLLAAAALALALVPMALAHLQLGYNEDVQAATVENAGTEDAVRTLTRTLDDVAEGMPARYAWSERRAAVTAVRDRLHPVRQRLNASRLDAGVAYGVRYDTARAQSWARTRCPGGPNRQFGACRADRGVIVQERSGDTHVLAVAVEIRVTGDTITRTSATVVRVGRWR
jgi:hypothetical protein